MTDDHCDGLHVFQNNAGMVLRDMRTKVSQCLSFDELARKLWKKWQVRGIISKHERFPLTKNQTRNITAEELATVAISRAGDKIALSFQKREALREAFASVPLKDRLQLKKLLQLDFELFGFDPSPDEVFPRQNFVRDPPGFSYFDLYP
jgi:hypothetical protein